QTSSAMYLCQTPGKSSSQDRSNLLTTIDLWQFRNPIPVKQPFTVIGKTFLFLPGISYALLTPTLPECHPVWDTLDRWHYRPARHDPYRGSMGLWSPDIRAYSRAFYPTFLLPAYVLEFL